MKWCGLTVTSAAKQKSEKDLRLNLDKVTPVLRVVGLKGSWGKICCSGLWDRHWQLVSWETHVHSILQTGSSGSHSLSLASWREWETVPVPQCTQVTGKPLDWFSISLCASVIHSLHCACATIGVTTPRSCVSSSCILKWHATVLNFMPSPWPVS